MRQDRDVGKSEGRHPAVPGSPSMVEDQGSCGYTNGEPTTGPAPPRAQEQPLGEGALERKRAGMGSLSTGKTNA